MDKYCLICSCIHDADNLVNVSQLKIYHQNEELICFACRYQILNFIKSLQDISYKVRKSEVELNAK